MNNALFKMLGIDETMLIELGQTIGKFSDKIESINARLLNIEKALFIEPEPKCIYDEMLKEEIWLTEKIKALYAVKQNANFLQMSDKMQGLTNDQYSAMVLYLDLLSKRINILNVKKGAKNEQN